MPRPHHSVSSVALGSRCERAWAYCYLDKIRSREVPWEEIEAGAACTSRERSASLGVATHACQEAWYLGDAAAAGLRGGRALPGPASLPMQVAQSARPHLPRPSECLSVAVESELDLVRYGVRWIGYRDLLASATPAACARIGVPEGLVIYDHKTTASISRYALSPAALARDPQACLYTIATPDAVACRWVYAETKESRRSLPVDAVVPSGVAHEVVEAMAATARRLDLIERSADAPQRVEACQDYGGCPYHVSAGGPCDARRSIGAMSVARGTKGAGTMTAEEIKAITDRINANKKAAAAPAEAPPPAAAPPAEAAPAPAPAAAPAAEAAPAPRPRGRPRATPAAAPAEAPAPAPAVGAVDVDAILAQQAALAEARTALDAARTVHDEARAAFEAAAAELASADAALAAIVLTIREACGA